MKNDNFGGVEPPKYSSQPVSVRQVKEDCAGCIRIATMSTNQAVHMPEAVLSKWNIQPGDKLAFFDQEGFMKNPNVGRDYDVLYVVVAHIKED